MIQGSQSITSAFTASALLLLKLLILHSLVKLLFFLYNFPVSVQGELLSVLFSMLKYALLNDLLVILSINLPLFILLSFIPLKVFPRMAWFICVLFMLISWASILLNIFDVFYFNFHRQRANADLLYVTKNLFDKTVVHHPWLSLIGIAVATWLMYVSYRIYRKCFIAFSQHGGIRYAALVFMLVFVLLFYSFRGIYVPAYPLLTLTDKELPYVQNSFHTFLYSVYRNKEGTVKLMRYLPEDVASVLVPVINPPEQSPYNSQQKNIVLFIMESVPQDFFQDGGKYRVSMPFIDSIRREGMYFTNAYSYSHNSNKGIVAILAGMPTITEIPLYHSSYTRMPITKVGKRLAAYGYRSMFFIGDDFDDFGFAKCVNWFGFQSYFSKENIPGYRKLESHTMGLHDEHVLSFMQAELSKSSQPFFAVHYNTSTHYPNDLPKQYVEKFPSRNFSAQMKSMSYYNECLEQFFKKASSQAWFRNTVFIFCSDHWMYPDTRSPVSDVVQSFRIPIFIYDPQQPFRKEVQAPVSQLDIVNTVMAISGEIKPPLSFGKNLLDERRLSNRVIFTKEDATIYQVIDSSHVLGFNIVTGKASYCYNYLSDPERKINLIGRENKVVDSLLMYIKAYLQNTSAHYLRTDKDF